MSPANPKHGGVASALKPNPKKSLKVLIASLSDCSSFCLQNTVPTAEATQPSRAPLNVGADLPFAGIDLLSLCALLAFNVTAPTNLALAGSGHLSTLSVMAAPAANSVTVLVLVALAGSCAR